MLSIFSFNGKAKDVWQIALILVTSFWHIVYTNWVPVTPQNFIYGFVEF